MSSRTTTGASCTVRDGVSSSFTYTDRTHYSQTLTDGENGNHGECFFPARLDHSHPLNVMASGDMTTGQTTGDFVKPIGANASFGTSKYYARQDHVHTLSGTTGSPSTLSGAIGLNTITYGSGDYTIGASGNLNSSWTRGSSRDSSNILCGVKLKLITNIRKTNYDTNIAFYWREVTVDSNGCIKVIGPETKSIFRTYAAE